MKKSLVLAFMLVLALGIVSLAATRDTATVGLDVDVAGHVEILGLEETRLSVSLTEPGQIGMDSARFEVRTNTDVKVGFVRDDKFPRLSLYDEDGERIASFKDPGTPQWSNPLKSDVQIRGGEGDTGTWKTVVAGRSYQWLDFRAHWDDRDDRPWWNVRKGIYEGQITVVVEALP